MGQELFGGLNDIASIRVIADRGAYKGFSWIHAKIRCRYWNQWMLRGHVANGHRDLVLTGSDDPKHSRRHTICIQPPDDIQ